MKIHEYQGKAILKKYGVTVPRGAMAADSSSEKWVRHPLLRYSPAIMLVIIAVADTGRFADPDLWGHIVFGRGVLTSGHLTRLDPYSYSAAGRVWNDHEWLAEVVLAFFYDTTGVVGLKMMKFLCTAATILRASGTLMCSAKDMLSGVRA